MKKKFQSNEDREIARMNREAQAWHEEIQRKGPKYQALLKKHEEWEKTEEYRESIEKLKDLVRRVNEQTGENLQVIDPYEEE